MKSIHTSNMALLLVICSLSIFAYYNTVNNFFSDIAGTYLLSQNGTEAYIPQFIHKFAESVIRSTGEYLIILPILIYSMGIQILASVGTIKSISRFRQYWFIYGILFAYATCAGILLYIWQIFLPFANSHSDMRISFANDLKGAVYFLFLLPFISFDYSVRNIVEHLPNNKLTK